MISEVAVSPRKRHRVRWATLSVLVCNSLPDTGWTSPPRVLVLHRLPTNKLHKPRVLFVYFFKMLAVHGLSPIFQSAKRDTVWIEKFCICSCCRRRGTGWPRRGPCWPCAWPSPGAVRGEVVLLWHGGPEHRADDRPANYHARLLEDWKRTGKRKKTVSLKLIASWAVRVTQAARRVGPRCNSN
jgi:hypothetical protein